MMRRARERAGLWKCAWEVQGLVLSGGLWRDSALALAKIIGALFGLLWGWRLRLRGVFFWSCGLNVELGRFRHCVSDHVHFVWLQILLRYGLKVLAFDCEI